jgi:hypothetical protein
MWDIVERIDRAATRAPEDHDEPESLITMCQSNVKAGTWIGPRYGRRQWEFEAEWNRGDEISCSEDRWSSPAPVRCTIDAIWARAKAAGGSFAVRLRRDRR